MKRSFFLCGVTGWCMEICFTALTSLHKDNLQLSGHTSLWMFPIYGCACFLAPVSRILCKRPIWFRGLIYMSLIFLTEYTTGSLLQKLKLCPWDYSQSRFHLHGLIRLDYAPFWFGAGLLFEALLRKDNALPVSNGQKVIPPAISSVYSYKSDKLQNKELP